ncbi:MULTISPECIES: phosphoribosylglycinamide formyltransferase [unclassified Granulicatella]|uniref:phosphoribosylglycinamide formyltransferase n=1 Tax=unclassified Granulicatella TaxID=2630493 RepID=UPI001073EF1F|nr:MULTISPECIES: phosphoribosylglycinamide formyltransferase [unclassified Granulicatella]MBF0779783.1 phosphoribosylglycinamide formyltransferase [Granulicatella sp. 19428wC4_WM01]TFU96185.1 phosphoribosylglycinamide formyltransferase [Granulicatella sp. WM01]
MRIAIFASGNGSNFEAIAKAVEEKRLSVQIASVVYDKKDAYVQTRAKKYNIPAYYFNFSTYQSKESYEQAILEQLKRDKVDFIVLAGYMKFIGRVLLQAYPNKILNIHPSLLPQFPGKSGIADAFKAKVSQTGVSVHLVDEGIDTGPILKQMCVSIDKEDTLESLTEKIHRIEHHLYPLVIQEYSEKLFKQLTNKADDNLQ